MIKISQNFEMVCDECGNCIPAFRDKAELSRFATGLGWKCVVWGEDGIDFKYICPNCFVKGELGCLKRNKVVDPDVCCHDWVFSENYLANGRVFNRHTGICRKCGDCVQADISQKDFEFYVQRKHKGDFEKKNG